MIEIEGAAKAFRLHTQGGALIEVLANLGLHVAPGECVALVGASGAGKSTLMRMIYGNYLAQAGRIVVGGVQQRVNIARGFVHDFPALLLDEPTASLDPANRAVAVELILEARARVAAILGIFHDAEARARVCDREIDVSAFAPRRDA